MSTEATAGRLFRYRDADGKWCAVWVEASTARALEAMERAYRRREATWQKTHVTATDLAGRGRRKTLIADAIGRGTAELRKSQLGNPWEGPRFSFAHLIGESRTWKGQPIVRGRCTFCNRAGLMIEQYCLGCDRCGRDLVIPTVKRDDLRRLAQTPNDGLKGGKG